jgi:hypothetical protein
MAQRVRAHRDMIVSVTGSTDKLILLLFMERCVSCVGKILLRVALSHSSLQESGSDSCVWSVSYRSAVVLSGPACGW